jgi:hypothetical protein
MHFDVYLVQQLSRPRALAHCINGKWAALEEQDAVPISTAARRILNVALNCSVVAGTKR